MSSSGSILFAKAKKDLKTKNAICFEKYDLISPVAYCIISKSHAQGISDLHKHCPIRVPIYTWVKKSKRSKNPTEQKNPTVPSGFEPESGFLSLDYVPPICTNGGFHIINGFS